jgi:hypothetical protein
MKPPRDPVLSGVTGCLQPAATARASVSFLRRSEASVGRTQSSRAWTSPDTAFSTLDAGPAATARVRTAALPQMVTTAPGPSLPSWAIQKLVSFCLDVRITNDLTIFVILAAHETNEIRAAHARGVEAQCYQFFMDVR